MYHILVGDKFDRYAIAAALLRQLQESKGKANCIIMERVLVSNEDPHWGILAQY